MIKMARKYQCSVKFACCKLHLLYLLGEPVKGVIYLNKKQPALIPTHKNTKFTLKAVKQFRMILKLILQVKSICSVFS